MRRLITCAVLLAAAAVAQQPTVSTLLSNGPTANRYDMVILGDGYTAAEQTRFDQDCQTFLTALFNKEPYRTFGQFFNVHTVFRPSLQSGANHPDTNPPIIRNPVYGASYNTGGTARCLYITNTSLALADAALAPANEGRVLVFVNDSRYGGCASTFAVSYNGTQKDEVQIHEIGHSIGSLADEYDYAGQTYTGPEPSQVNATANSTGQKWSHWWGFNGVSAFQGARYYQYGLWRPRSNCLMRTLGQALCPVCIEQTTRVLNSVVNAIDQPSPSTNGVTLGAAVQQTFSFTSLVPPANNPLITWRLNGQVVPGATGQSYLLDTATLGLGAHTLQVSVQDRTTFVRNDPNSSMVSTRTWGVSVVDPTVPDLRMASVTPVIHFVQAGQAIPLTTTVVNDGPGNAGAFTVEHFLSADSVLDPGDLFLGGYQVAGLAATQADVTHRAQVVLPHSMTQATWIVIAVADRTDQVREQNEANNEGRSFILAQPPSCTVALEYRDPMVYPRDAAAVSIQQGGTVLPTVVARCAAPGTLYVIAWGCSGTQPGTTLPPNLTLPLNQDLCTALGLQAMNGAVFQQFWGLLDAQGVGRATLAWPAGLPIVPMPGHFAAVLLDGSTAQFAGVSNAVRIDLQ